MLLVIILNHHEPNILLLLQSINLPTQQGCRGRDKKVLLGTVAEVGTIILLNIKSLVAVSTFVTC